MVEVVKELPNEMYIHFLQRWKESDERIRSAVIADQIFGLNVNMQFLMITEEKETGGIRLIHLPKYCQRESSQTELLEKMRKRGWEAETTLLPRSEAKKAIVQMFHPETGMKVESYPCPEPDAIRMAAMMAYELEAYNAYKNS